MPDFSRRQLLAGTAAIGALAALPARAQKDAPSPAGDPDLSGKSILITGCSSGFGHIGALHYARLGAKTFATMRDMPRPEAETLRAAAAEQGLDLHVIEIDVLSLEQVAAGVAEAERIAGGGLDVLVNNAGIGIAGPVEMQDMDAVEAMFGTNVFGYQRMARAVLPGMRTKGSGLIFNVSSQLGRVIAPNIGLYSPTKFAVEALSEQMAYELVPQGIEVTIIEPGGYPTAIWENGDRYTRQLLERTGEERLAAYSDFVDNAARSSGGGGNTDPMDVPRAIAGIIGMEPGTRPLRRAVHPGPKPQQAINRVSRETQLTWLGGSGYGPWIRAAQD